MRTAKLLQNCAFVLPLLFALAGCGAPANAPQEQPTGVQDIQPGDKSIIQTPATSRGTDSQLEERNI